MLDTKDWPRTMESLEEFFGSCLGVTKIPLGYVIRKELAPEQQPVGGWSSHEAEMIGRAPIVHNVNAVPMVYTEHFKTDNKAVWSKLATLCRDDECWTYIRTYQRDKNGRLAYWALYNHYLGAHNVDTLCARAEQKLLTTVYHGETKRFNWERFTRIHVDQHAILTGLMQYGYQGIDERSKVRFLLGGIRTPALTPCTANMAIGFGGRASRVG